MRGAARAVLSACVAGLAGGLYTYAALSPASQLFGRTLIAGADPNEVALTFDDGPNGDTTLRLLDILARHQACATFFLIGGFVRRQPQVVRAIAAAGHLLGNHTETHPWLHRLSARRIHDELAACTQALEEVVGAPVRYFRPPHGARRPCVLQVAHALGMVPVQWNVMGKDWLLPQDSLTLTARLERGIAWNRRLRRGSNILLHDGSDRGLGADRTATLQAVDRLLSCLPALRCRVVRVDAWDPPRSPLQRSPAQP